MVRVVWRRTALDDLADIIRYIDQFDPVAARDIGVRLFDLGESLNEFPRRGRPVGGNIREMTNVPPYLLRYEVHEDKVFILNIHHGRQRRDQ